MRPPSSRCARHRMSAMSYASSPVRTAGRGRILVGPAFEQLTRLAIEHLADLGERVEAHAAHLAGLEQRDVLLGDADALGEFLGAHLALGEHDVEVDD